MEQETYNLLEEWYTSEVTNSLFEVVSEYGYYQHFSKDDLREIIKELEFTVTEGNKKYSGKQRELYKDVLLEMCDYNDLESKLFN